MNNRLTLFYLALLPLFISNMAIAQTPQAFSYQAVATDNTGRELLQQAIGIKATILQGNMPGVAVWVETHNATTDEFGLFTLSIGQGTPQSAVAPTFADIDWSSGPYFLRIDMDATGGTNYAFVGTTQLLSVPYSLYSRKSETANMATYADSASVANEAERSLFSDSAGAANYAQRAAIADSAVVARRAYLADRADFADSAAVAHSANMAERAVWSDSSEIAELAVLAANALVADYANNAATAASTAFASYAGIANYAELAGTAIDDNDTDPTNELQTLSINRDTIRISNGNFVALNSVSPFNAPGATIDFPQGTENAFFLYIFNNYTVPAGRNLYITASESEIRLPNVGAALGRHFTTPSQPVIPAGFSVSNCRCTGFLVNQSAAINPVVIVLQPNNGNSYQVPTGRYLMIKSGISPTMPISFDTTVIDFFSSSVKALVAPSGVTLRNPNNEEIILTGYLKNNL